MTNREKYGEQILDHLEEYGCRPAMVNGEFTSCRDTNCRDCDFNGHGEACATKFREWLKFEYIPQPDIPLDTPIDTPILVWDDREDYKHKRYFAGFEGNKIKTFAFGATSWSCTDRPIESLWEHAELVNKEDLK